MIVDAHVHLWDVQRNPQPWITDEIAVLNRTFSPADLEPLLAAAGVDAVIVVQGAALDHDTDYLFDMAREYEWIAAITAWVDLLDVEKAARRLDELSGRGKLRAVRHLVNIEEDEHWLMQPAVLKSLALLDDRGLILEVPVEFPRHFDDLVALAQLLPGLSIVVDHLGKPPLGTPAMEVWETKLNALAGCANVSAKVSGLNTALARKDWSAEDLRPAVEAAVRAFGPERLLCGSDWPVALLNGTYERVWDATRRLAVEVAGAGAPDLLGGTAARLYALR